MLIKGVTRKGDAVVYSAEEALASAVLYGLKQNHNGPENLFWIKKGSITTTAFSKTITDPKTRDWTASASGSVLIGRTCMKTDRFHVPRKYSFDVQYQSSKDEWGIPDIKIVSFALEPVEPAAPKLDLAQFEAKQPAAPLAAEKPATFKASPAPGKKQKS